jgi:hypothetical protein
MLSYNYLYFCEQHSSAVVVILSFLFLFQMSLHAQVRMNLFIADQ